MTTLIKSPLPGKILRISVEEGQKIRKGEVLFVLESMKMHNDIISEYDGVVSQILATENSPVPMNANIIEIQKL
jgi:biotin carboxyl carrier protein